jgi:uncharacterized protein (TIGR03435 family)
MKLRRNLTLTVQAAIFAASGVPGGSAQSAQSSPKPAFEVASVKRSGPQAGTVGIEGKIIGGPGTADPLHVRGKRVTLFALIRTAYDVASDQISGPGWLQEEHYDITAEVPKGSAKSDVKLMLQNLLADRFRLSLHRESRELPVMI